jgi:hypothetical protein
MLARLVFVPLLVSIVACTPNRTEPEGYRVVGYDAATHQWTILRTGVFDGKYLTKRLVVVCSLYRSGDREAVTGPDACHLQVGNIIVPNPMPPEGKREQFVDVYEMPGETLSITQGDRANRVVQQFDILKYEVLPDGASH